MSLAIGRRHFLLTGLAAGAMPLTKAPAVAFQNSPIRYGFSGQAWMGASPGRMPASSPPRSARSRATASRYVMEPAGRGPFRRRR